MMNDTFTFSSVDWLKVRFRAIPRPDWEYDYMVYWY
jgi:hypothetical protein